MGADMLTSHDLNPHVVFWSFRFIEDFLFPVKAVNVVALD